MAVNLFNFDKQWMSIDTQRYPQKETFNFQDFQNKYWKPVKSSVKSSATLTSRDEVPMTQELTPIKANIQPTTKLVSRSDIMPKTTQNIDNNIKQQAISDLNAGMPIAEFDKYYPELSEMKQIFTEYISDIQAWMPESEASTYYPELFTTDTTQVQQPTTNKPKWLASFKEWTENVIWWAISQLPKIAWNVWGFLVWKPIDFALSKLWVNVPSLEAEFKKQWVSDKKWLQNLIWVDEEAFTTQLWEVGAEIWTLFTPTWWVKVAWKIAEKAPAVVKWLENLSQKAPKIYNTLKSWLIWAKEVWKFEIATEWEVTPQGLLIWAVANPLIWKTIEWVGKISKAAAEKLQVMWLLNPAKLNMVWQQLKTQWVENLSVAEYLLKNNIKWNKDKIVSQLERLAKQNKQIVDNSLKAIPWTYKNEAVNEILSFMRKDFSWVPGQKEVVNRISELFKKATKWKGLTLTEINEVKRIVDRQLNLFTQTWDVRAWATKEWLTKLRWEVQKFIENTASKQWFNNIKQLNKNTQVNMTLADAITRKDAADQARELLTAFAPGWIWAIGWALQWWEDAFERLKNIVLWAAIWQVAGSTTLKTNTASLLNKLSWLQRKALIDFIESKWATPISSEIIKIIQE